MRRKTHRITIEKQLSDTDITELLQAIGEEIRIQTTGCVLDRFAYEAGLSRSRLASYHNGSDMLLSSFLRLTGALNYEPGKFLAAVYRKLDKQRHQLTVQVCDATAAGENPKG